jgi:hypothetical protein
LFCIYDAVLNSSPNTIPHKLNIPKYDDQTELTTSIAEWIDASHSALSMLKAQAPTTDRICCKALFPGSDESDPDAIGTEIFSNPKNFPLKTIKKLLLIL